MVTEFSHQSSQRGWEFVDPPDGPWAETVQQPGGEKRLNITASPLDRSFRRLGSTHG